VTQPASILAAGLILGEFGVPADCEDDLQAKLRGLSQRLTLWEAGRVDTPANYWDALGRPLVRWRQPERIDAQVADYIASLWPELMPHPEDPDAPRFLRVSVGDAESARVLLQLGPIVPSRGSPIPDRDELINWTRDPGAHLSIGGCLFVVPSLAGGYSRFRWRWPLRVGIFDGPRADRWLAELGEARHHGLIFDAELVNLTADWPDDYFDIVILDAAAVPNSDDPRTTRVGEAACVIAAGGTDPEEMLRTLVNAFAPPIAAAVPGEPGEWWTSLYLSLCHDLPIDVAAWLACPTALVVLPEFGSDVTAVAHWAAAAAFIEPSLTVPAEMDSLSFLHEGEGARRIAQRVRVLAAAGHRATLEVRPPPVLNGESVEKQRASKRHLIAEFWRAEEDEQPIRLDGALPPTTPLLLEVRIAIPEKGQRTFAREPFPEPTDAIGSARLDVVVTGSVWPTPQVQEISLPMRPEHRDEPSTSAVFEFTTPVAGMVVEFDIVVRYRNHPLQAAKLTATVRRVSLPRERARLLTYRVSGPHEPTETASWVDVGLDMRTGRLVDPMTGNVAALDTEGILSAFEEALSKALGNPDAPGSLQDKRSLELLVDLARQGSELRKRLQSEGFDLERARSIDLMVRANTPVLPLELVYEGVAPAEEGASLCDHIKDPPPEGEGCTSTSKTRVCPYAFWGLRRVISRTVMSNGDPGAGSATSLVLSPVLYAAAKVADEGSRSPTPSQRLLEAVEGLFGPVKRVESWRAWRRAVKEMRPALLVLLGHAETYKRRVTLRIGSELSGLAQADISSAELRREDAPSPLVVLTVCAGARHGGPFGTLLGALVAEGASAVISSLGKINGPQGASATAHVLAALHDAAASRSSLGDSLMRARRDLLAQGLLLGLALVSHGEIDTRVSA